MMKRLKFAVLACAVVVSAGLLAAGLGAARADEPGMSPLLKLPAISAPPGAAPTPPVSVLGWGDANASCAEWTNGCIICKRDEAGSAACSTPGIACQPKAISCSRQVEKKP